MTANDISFESTELFWGFFFGGGEGGGEGLFFFFFKESSEVSHFSDKYDIK